MSFSKDYLYLHEKTPSENYYNFSFIIFYIYLFNDNKISNIIERTFLILKMYIEYLGSELFSQEALMML